MCVSWEGSVHVGSQRSTYIHHESEYDLLIHAFLCRFIMQRSMDPSNLTENTSVSISTTKYFTLALLHIGHLEGDERLINPTLIG